MQFVVLLNCMALYWQVFILYIPFILNEALLNNSEISPYNAVLFNITTNWILQNDL